MATNTTRSLEQKIENEVQRLVLEHVAECEAAATRAVGRAFRGVTRSSARPKGRSRSASGHRSREELAALEARLYEAICAHPGETMAVLAPVVGATARQLNRPATVLRSSGRVRSVGQRQATRYFPMEE